jgi:predicted nucleotide-binding protein
LRRLTRPEIYRVVNDWIGVSGGYLGDLGYASHSEFYPYYCDLDIDPSQLSGTTRQRFIKILEEAEPAVQAKILRGVLAKYKPGSADTRSVELHRELLRIIDELEDPQPLRGIRPRPVRPRPGGPIAQLAASSRTTASTKGTETMDSVFVVHGRDRRLARELFRLLRALHVKPLEWNSLIEMTGKPAPHISEILEVGFSRAAAVVVLFTPDDVGRLRDDLQGRDELESDRDFTGQARLNVVFEAGLAFGTHPERTVLVQVGNVRPFSDLAGRHIVRLDNSARSRKELATKLRNAGCAVDDAGTDWLEEGDFTAP